MKSAKIFITLMFIIAAGIILFIHDDFTVNASSDIDNSVTAFNGRIENIPRPPRITDAYITSHLAEFEFERGRGDSFDVSVDELAAVIYVEGFSDGDIFRFNWKNKNGDIFYNSISPCDGFLIYSVYDRVNSLETGNYSVDIFSPEAEEPDFSVEFSVSENLFSTVNFIPEAGFSYIFSEVGSEGEPSTFEVSVVSEKGIIVEKKLIDNTVVSNMQYIVNKDKSVSTKLLESKFTSLWLPAKLKRGAEWENQHQKFTILEKNQVFDIGLATYKNCIVVQATDKITGSSLIRYYAPGRGMIVSYPESDDIMGDIILQAVIALK